MNAIICQAKNHFMFRRFAMSEMILMYDDESSVNVVITTYVKSHGNSQSGP